MQVNRQQFLEQGYLVLREIIPTDRLQQLRADFEVLVGRQRKIWAQERGPDDPPGGDWETRPQPRLVSYNRLIDEATASTVEVWLQENTLGVSRQLLSVPEAASVAGMMLMCSPVRDHGPARWHRDVHPIDMAPLSGLQKDLVENGPKYVQWNIPLYDDDVLWIVPGSHRRVNTETEDRELLEDPRRALTSGVPVELNAGDGVVYVNYMLHWGSAYSPKIRRTIHGGHSIFPYYPDMSFSEYLSPEARTLFTQWDQRGAELQDWTEAGLRAVLNGDAGAYETALGALELGWRVPLDGSAAARRRRGRQDGFVDLPVQGGSAYPGFEASQLGGDEWLLRPAGRHYGGLSQPRARRAPDFDQLGTPVCGALHGARGSCSAQALCDAGQEAEGGGGSFRAQLPVQPDALLFQRDAGRFHAGGFYRQLELTLAFVKA